MVVYSFYIFDRHTECVYSRRWTPRVVSKAGRPQSGNSITGNGDLPPSRKGLSNEDDAKLIFGTVFSLRGMCSKLGGDDNSFVSYRTGEYKLHYFETATRMKFVMLTGTAMPNLRTHLYQIWANIWLEYVVKNPLSPVEHTGGVGIANELFEAALERFKVVSIEPLEQDKK